MAIVATGCLEPSRRPARDLAPTFLSVNFYRARPIDVVSHLLALDATTSVVEDVVGLGGRVTAFRNDTLLIEPYYITMFDPSRDDHARTFYRGGAYRLPDLAIVETGAGIVVSEFITPAARESQGLEKVLAFGPRLFGLLLLLSVLKPLWHH